MFHAYWMPLQKDGGSMPRYDVGDRSDESACFSLQKERDKGGEETLRPQRKNVQGLNKYEAF